MTYNLQPIVNSKSSVKIKDVLSLLMLFVIHICQTARKLLVQTPAGAFVQFLHTVIVDSILSVDAM